MAARPSDVTSTADREIVSTRVLDAPRALVFKVWTDPQHVAQWWGPKGFTTTTREMDVRPGGVWRFVMHGPDGVDYQNKIVFIEVVKPARLVYRHAGEADTEPVRFHVTVTFDEEGGKTRLTMRSVFETAAERDHVVKTYGAIEGAKQTLGRLAEHLAALQGGGSQDERPFVITRVLNAPRELVFKVWTEREHLLRWWGPKGVTIVSCENDLRPGGVMHYCMRWADGSDVWGRWVYREIVAPERLVFVNSFSDEQAGVSRHPMAPTWPRELLTTVTFLPHAGKSGGTVVTVTWTPLDASEEERKTFAAGHESMRNGWTGTFEQLADYLAKL